MNAPIAPLLLSEAEAARALAVCTRTLRTLRQEGKIHYVTVRGRILYAPADLHRFVESNRTCASINAKGRPTGGSMRPSGVADFAEAQAKRRAAQRN